MDAIKHSPGPWIFCGDHVDAANGLPLLRSARSFDDLNCYDIRLAAAAPTLLSELEGLIEMARSVAGNWESGQLDKAVRNLVRVADEAELVVARAKGEQHVT